MAPENVSPEEKLFKIIKEGKNAPSGNQSSPDAQVKNGPEEAKPISAGANPLKQLFSHGLNIEPARIGHGHETAVLALPLSFRPEDLKALNRLLVVLLIVIAAAAFYYLLSKRPSISEITAGVSDIPFQKEERKAIEAFKPLDFYLEAVNERDILQSAPVKKEEALLSEEKLPKKKLPELASSLKLQGISWGPVPKAMIMDNVDSQVYFVKKGQNIGATGIEVKEITKDKVTLGYEKEEMELL